MRPRAKSRRCRVVATPAGPSSSKRHGTPPLRIIVRRAPDGRAIGNYSLQGRNSRTRFGISSHSGHCCFTATRRVVKVQRIEFGVIARSV
jgi:hypothetical protein